MRTRTLTAAQHQRALERARATHDARYRVDNPEPTPESFSDELTLLERAAGHLWIIWTVLALAGGFISLPHTLRTVLSTVDLPGWQARAYSIGWQARAYSIAVFIGVELALIGVALASELKRSEELDELPIKQWSAAGALNGLFARLGFRPVFDTSHLPERRPASGGGLVVLLFAASLTFNLADTLADVTLLQPYAAEIHLAARVMAGVLGPGLLLIAGHRFAVEVVKAASGRRSQESQYRAALEQWRQGLQQSWLEHSDIYIQNALAHEWSRRNPGAPEGANPYVEEELPAGFFAAGLGGNGSRGRAGR